MSIGAEGRSAEAQTSGRGGAAVGDVRWYRAGYVRPRRASSEAGLIAAQASPAPARRGPRPVHSGVQAYQRVLASPKE